MRYQNTSLSPILFFKVVSDYDLNLGRCLNPELTSMRNLASLYFLNRHTFVCGSLFPGIKLNQLYRRKQTSKYKSAILAQIQRIQVVEFAITIVQYMYRSMRSRDTCMMVISKRRQMFILFLDDHYCSTMITTQVCIPLGTRVHPLSYRRRAYPDICYLLIVLSIDTDTTRVICSRNCTTKFSTSLQYYLGTGQNPYPGSLHTGTRVPRYQISCRLVLCVLNFVHIRYQQQIVLLVLDLQLY